MAKTKDALEILERVTGDDAQLRKLIEEETFNAHIARLICHARTEAGLSQQQLAELVGTKQPCSSHDHCGGSRANVRQHPLKTALIGPLAIRIAPCHSWA